MDCHACLRMTFGTSAGRRGMADAQLASVACSRASAAGMVGGGPRPLVRDSPEQALVVLEQGGAIPYRGASSSAE